MIFRFVELLAQTSTSPTGPANGSAPGGPPPDQTPMLIMWAVLIGMLVFMFVMSRKQRKREEQRKQDMLNSLSKNDRVMTIGGIVGTVVTVKDKEVVLKVDESTNTKMTFARRAIQQVITGDDEPTLES